MSKKGDVKYKSVFTQICCENVIMQFEPHSYFTYLEKERYKF